jgi:signal transduction histidine kinase
MSSSPTLGALPAHGDGARGGRGAGDVRTLTPTDRSLVEVFCSRLSVAFDNVILYEGCTKPISGWRSGCATARRRSPPPTIASAQWTRLRRANDSERGARHRRARLKNPLGVILGRAEMLNELAAMEPLPLARIQDQLGHIRASARQLTEMVNELISDAMMDTLDIAIRNEPIDLAAMLAEIVVSNRALAEKKQQNIHFVSPPHQIWNCDPDRLREAVDNLVSNAIKYTPVGGRMELAMSVDDGGIAICVRDEGPGLSQEDMSRLFGRFQRLSARPTGGESSTGLGLSIVKRIVELHGGTVGAESAGPGQGATFIIRLPATSA